MTLKIDSLNQRCDGLQIKARGMGKRLQLSEYREAERKYEVVEKNFIIIRDSVSDSDLSDTMQIQKSFQRNKLYVLRGTPASLPGSRVSSGHKGERRIHFLVVS